MSELTQRGMSISCGVQELVGLYSRPESLLKAYSRRVRPFAHIVFSDTVGTIREPRTTGGLGLAAFIKAQKLGTVVQSPIRVNPNSGNRIAVWIWTPNKRALRAWLKMTV